MGPAPGPLILKCHPERDCCMPAAMNRNLSVGGGFPHQVSGIVVGAGMVRLSGDRKARLPMRAASPLRPWRVAAIGKSVEASSTAHVDGPVASAGLTQDWPSAWRRARWYVSTAHRSASHSLSTGSVHTWPDA